MISSPDLGESSGIGGFSCSEIGGIFFLVGQDLGVIVTDVRK